MKYVIRVGDKYVSGSYIGFNNDFSFKYFIPTLESIDHAIIFNDLETPTEMLRTSPWQPLDYIIGVLL